MIRLSCATGKGAPVMARSLIMTTKTMHNAQTKTSNRSSEPASNARIDSRKRVDNVKEKNPS